MTTTGFYGTATETFFVTSAGTVFLVQGPDMRDSNPEQIDSLPADARPLNPRNCADIDVSGLV